MNNTAVLIIDVQQALCSGRYAAHDAGGLIERLNRVNAQARAAGVPVVFVQHESDDELLAHGSPGWQLADGLQVQDGDLFVRKRASDSFHNTELHTLLQARGVQHLVIGGLQTEFCVDTTVRRALALGYPVTLLADGHSTMDNPVLKAPQIIAHHNLTLSWLDSFGPRARPVPVAELTLAG